MTGSSGAPDLLARLSAVADGDGFVPFDRFMDVALYADGVGRYARTPGPIGPGGDFYTAPSVHPLFAQSLAERLASVLRALPAEPRRRIVELGPGDGTLAAAVVAHLGRTAPDLRGIDVTLVDRSAALLAHAEPVVREAARSLPFEIGSAQGLAEVGPFSGVVYANELLDAQPARRLEWDGARWLELGVRLDGPHLRPDRSAGPPAVGGRPLPRSPEPGTTFEVSPGADALVREIGDHLVRGVAIVIDYGMEETELVAAHRHGTLAAVRGHRAVDDPLEAAGEADLSTFVNFTRLRDAVRASGLKVWSERSQAEALGAWGFPHLLEEAVRAAPTPEAEVRVRLAAKNLLFGFERFRVLELGPTLPLT